MIHYGPSLCLQSCHDFSPSILLYDSMWSYVYYCYALNPSILLWTVCAHAFSVILALCSSTLICDHIFVAIFTLGHLYCFLTVCDRMFITVMALNHPCCFEKYVLMLLALSWLCIHLHWFILVIFIFSLLLLLWSIYTALWQYVIICSLLLRLWTHLYCFGTVCDHMFIIVNALNPSILLRNSMWSCSQSCLDTLLHWPMYMPNHTTFIHHWSKCTDPYHQCFDSMTHIYVKSCSDLHLFMTYSDAFLTLCPSI